uniref:Protein kinase domain-containing protein n=1 Tax=Caenorhabditis tropicalis TaxID=1561998 RepID=A0A1I7TII6_9PELO
MKGKSEAQHSSRAAPVKKEPRKYRRTSQMEEFIGEVKLPGRIRATSYNCEVRRSGIISTQVTSNNTVCVWNDQTGQSVVVASNQSTRDALASLCQQDTDKIGLKTIEDRARQEIDFMKMYSEEYMSRSFSGRYRSQSVCLRKPKKSLAYIDPANLTSDEAQAMFYTYLNFTQQAQMKKSQKLKAESQLQPFLDEITNSAASTSSYPLNTKPEIAQKSAIAIKTLAPISEPSHAVPKKKDNRSHFGMSRFLEKTPSCSPPSSPVSRTAQKHDTSGPSATPNESLFLLADQTRNKMQEGANPSTVVDMGKVSTPALCVISNTSAPKSSTAVAHINVGRPIKIETDLEMVTYVRQNSVVPAVILPDPSMSCSKNTPSSDFTHEDLIAFLKGPLAMAKAAELAALKEKATESKPKRKTLAKTAARRSMQADSNVVETVKQRTTAVSRLKSIKCNRSHSTPSNVTVFSCAGKNLNRTSTRHMETPLC